MDLMGGNESGWLATPTWMAAENNGMELQSSLTIYEW